jgi:indole-3-glycerol phosphate synthase
VVGAKAAKLRPWPGCSRPARGDITTVSEKALRKAKYAELVKLADSLGLPPAAGSHEEEDLKRRILQCRID